MREKLSLKTISDDDLLRRLSEILGQSRRVESDLVAHIAEVDARRLFAREAAPSMFAYCTERLHLSEPEAYLRIAVARASRRHPVLLTMLADGRLHLSGIERLAPHLTEKNCEAFLKRASHKSKREIEELVAELAPRPQMPASMRKLSARGASRRSGSLDASPELRPDGVGPVAQAIDSGGPPPGGRGAAGHPDGELRPDGVGVVLPPGPERSAAIEPVAPARYRVRFDASAELRGKLERLQALMRSSVPDGDLAEIIDAAVTEKLERLEAKRFGKTKKPRKSLAQADTTSRSRHIPAAVRRAVHERDGSRCTYRDKRGRRCTKLHDLEFHHREPFGQGGDHGAETVCLMCRTHNTLMAEQDYGKEVMKRFRRSASCVSEPIRGYGTGSGFPGDRPRGVPGEEGPLVPVPAPPPSP